MAGVNDNQESGTQKEATKPRMSRDETDVRNIMNTVESMTDPYEYSVELASISSGVIASQKIKDDLLSGPEKGEKQLKEFIEKRLLSNEVDFFDPLPKLKLSTFSENTIQKRMKVSGSEIAIKADRAFFSKLVTIAKVRDLDLHEVYSHELGPIPWALATVHGTLCKTEKSVLLKELEKDTASLNRTPQGAAWIIDGMALIQVLRKPSAEAYEKRVKWKPQTFADVAESILFCICHTSKNASRVDFVIDQYCPLSIKTAERKRRKEGSTTEGRRINIRSRAQRAPSDWANYLTNSENKQDLPEFLFREWLRDSDGKYQRILKDTT